MVKRRILVSVMPFAGHVAPVTGVVGELISRGHEVAVHTGSRYLHRFESLGARGIPWSAASDFDEHDLPTTFPALERHGPRRVFANLEHVFIRTGEGQARDLLAAHETTPFDVIAGDVMSLGAGLAAELTGLPWATLSIVPLSLPSVDLPPSGLALHPGNGRFGRARDATLRSIFRAAAAPLDRVLREVRTALGLEPGHRFEGALYSPQLVIATGAPSLEYPRSDLGSQFEFVGRLAPAGQSVAERPSWWPDLSSTRKPVVLITQGTFNIDPRELLEPALTAFADLDVLTLGTTAGSRIHGQLPENARLAERLDFAEVLPHSHVVVSNGGWGGVLEALSYGIPLIVAGGDLDKPEIAARVAWSGVGIDLRTGRPTAAKIRNAYRLISRDPSFADQARRIGTDMQTLGGASRAAELIERLASGAGIRE